MGKNICGGPLQYPSGLTAVICPSLDRVSIYQALKKKHCYATTGARILLDIDVDCHDTYLKVDLDIAGTNLLDQCWVFKNGIEVHQTYLDSEKIGRLDWTDNEFTEKDTCYIRIRQMDGQMAWINPVPFASP